MTNASNPLSDDTISRWMNPLALLGICGVLLMALVWQVAYKELPCPLCELQRVGFIMAGIGIFLNVRFGASPLHYAMVIFSSLAGSMTSVRQVLLHIAPGDHGYGSPFFGLHFYTWALVIFTTLIFWAALMLVIDRHFPDNPRTRARSTVVWLIAWLFFSLVAINLGSTLLECGFGACADDPVFYQWLHRAS